MSTNSSSTNSNPTIATPIVQEENFPQPNSRLQEIMAEYGKDHPAPPPKQGSILANVTVKNEVKTKTFDELKPEKKEKVVAIVKSTDYMTSGDIQTLGSAKQSSLTKNSEIVISKYTAAQAGPISDPITSLVATLRTKNPKEVTSKILSSDKEGAFSSMFSLKNARKKLAKALAEHDSILKNFQAIEVELKNKQLSLMNDIKIYEEMGRATYAQVSEFENYSIALNLMLEDAQAKLDIYKAKDELDLDDYNEISSLESAIERMKRKEYSLQTMRVATIQTIPQLAVLIKGDEIICEKIDEIISLVIPLWSWQYAIAVGALNQKEAIDINKSVRGVTSKLLTDNAKLLHDNAISAQEELYAAAVAVEDLATVQDYIDDMVTKVSEISKQASQKCVEGLRSMRSIEERNYALFNKGIE